jgi:antitoxin (DNA-binding transcriptional repressor) of toxin-antitoxin stability system
MKSANISEIRDHLSEYLRTVRKGETVIVYDRETPIARLEPIPPSGHGHLLFYRRVLSAGIVTPPRIIDDALKTLPPPRKSKQPARLVEAFLEERRGGR